MAEPEFKCYVCAAPVRGFVPGSGFGDSGHCSGCGQPVCAAHALYGWEERTCRTCFDRRAAKLAGMADRVGRALRVLLTGKPD